jgi:hypothetical protein
MSMETCLPKLQKFLKDSGLEKNISPERTEYFARLLSDLAGESKTPAEFAAAAQKLIEKDFAAQAEAAKLSKVKTLLAVNRSVNLAIENKARWQESISKSGKISKALQGSSDSMAFEAARSMIEGYAARPGKDSRISPVRLEQALLSHFWETFRTAVGENEKFFPAGNVGNLDENAFRALHAMDNNLPIGDMDRLAVAYAKGLKAVRDAVFLEEQAVNPLLKRADNYLWMHIYDPDRTRTLGESKFVSMMMKEAGEGSFTGHSSEQKETIFRYLYQEITTGIRNITGEGDTLAKMASSRSIKFNDSEAFIRVNKEIGPPVLYDSLNRLLSQSARNIASLTKFGPRPQRWFEQFVELYRRQLSTSERAYFDQRKNTLSYIFDVAGKGAQKGIPSNGVARLGENLNSVAYMSKATLSIFHALPADLVLSGGLLRSLTGEGMLGSITRFANEYAKSAGSGEYRAKMLRRGGLVTNALRLEYQAMLGSPDGGMTGLGKAAQKYSSMVYHAQHVDNTASAWGALISNILQEDVISHEWGKIPEQLRGALESYGLGENEHALLQKMTNEIDGDKFVAPQGAALIPEENIKEYLKKSGIEAPTSKNINEVRSDLRNKVAVMINDHAALGSARTDVRQRAFMWRNTNPNEPMGILLRMVTFLKGASVTSADVYRRNFLSGKTLTGDWAGLASALVMSTVMMAISRSLGQLALGKTPPDYTKPEEVATLLLESGFAGGYTGVILGGIRESHGFKDKTLAMMGAAIGPVPEMAARAAGAGAQALLGENKSGAKKELKSAAGRLAVESLPGVGAGLGSIFGPTGTYLGSLAGSVGNTVYTKAAFDYYIANQIREFIRSGYMNALERSVHDRGQKYLFAKPTGRSFTEGD